MQSRGGNQIGTFGIRDDRIDQVTPLDWVAGDQPDVAVDLWALVRGAADYVRIRILDEHLHGFANPCLCPLADQLVREIGHPHAPGLDLLRSMLPVQPTRLRTLLS
jgi:hypothetical protein